MPPATTVPPTTVPPTVPPTTVPPVEVGTLLEELRDAGTYDTLVSIVENSLPVLPGLLEGFDTFTALAPLDEAFVGKDALVELLTDPADPDAAAQFVLGLIEEGRISLASLVTAGSFDSLGVGLYPVVSDGAGQVTIGGAVVVDPDRPASNGVIQGVSSLPVPTVAATPLPAPAP